MTIEEIESEIKWLEKETDRKKAEKHHFEEIYSKMKVRLELYSTDVRDLQEKIQSLQKSLNEIQPVMNLKKSFPDDVNVEEMNRNISEIKSQIEGLFENIRKIIEFRQKQMNEVIDEIEGVQDK